MQNLKRIFQPRYFSDFSPSKKSNANANETCSVLVEKQGSVTTIGINRPNKRNSLDVDTIQRLSKAVNEFEDDNSSQIAILHGIGGNFCAGYDMEEIVNNEENLPDLFNNYMSANLTNRFIKKPLIAAVSGYAAGSGMELALMCDFRVVEETAVMGLFNRRFGIPSIDGATVRLQIMVGLSQALDLVCTGRGLTSNEALQLGLVTRLVACGTALGQSINLASSLLKFPQKCLNADRAAIYFSTFQAKSVEEAYEYHRRSINEELMQESLEGAKKFLKGIGKHGKFYNIHVRQKKYWEDET